MGLTGRDRGDLRLSGLTGFPCGGLIGGSVVACSGEVDFRSDSQGLFFDLVVLFDDGFLIASQTFIDFVGDLAVAVIQIIARTGLVRIIAVNGHITAVSVVYAVRLVRRPDQFLNPVSLTDVSHQVDQGGEGLVVYGVGVFRIRRDFDRDRAVVVGATGRTPGTVLFFDIHSDSAVDADAVIRRRLSGSRREDISQGFDRTLADDTMDRDRVDLLISGTGLVRGNFGVAYKGTIAHFQSRPFPL